jgi:nucleoside-diphosphate-sugar epimerase
MSILVIGGTGFIGKAVVSRILKTESKVVVMSRRIQDFPEDTQNRVDSVAGDVRLFSDVLKIIHDYKISRIIHAAYTLTVASAENPLAAIETNVLGATNVFEAARIMGVKRVVFCSSLTAYASQEMYGDRMVTEDEILMKPASLYGATKLLNEFVASSFEKKYGLEIPFLRIAGVYGLGTEKQALMSWPSKMTAAAVYGDSVRIPIRSDEKASFIHVQDVAEQLFRLCTEVKLNYRVYNSGGYAGSGREFLDIVKNYYPDLVVEFDKHAPSFWPYPSRLDGTRISREINWEIRDPETGLLDMLNKERSTLGLEPLKKK